jgi:hypothetical protein
MRYWVKKMYIYRNKINPNHRYEDIVMIMFKRLFIKKKLKGLMVIVNLEGILKITLESRGVKHV